MKILAIDIGGTFVKYGIIDENLTIEKKNKKATIKSSLNDFMDEIKGIWDEFKDEASGVAFSMPGFVNSQSGYAKTGGALDHMIHEMNIKEEFEKHLDTKVSVANDADCAAMAEMQFGSLTGYNDAAVYIIGTGIGGSLIHKGEILQGRGFASGEFSFMLTDYDNPSFSNVLALKCGSPTLTSRVAAVMNREDMSGEEVFELIKVGNKDAIEALQVYSQYIAVSLLNIQCIYDPEVIAIGGGVSQQELLLESISQSINKIEEQNNNCFPAPKIVRCKFCNDANLIGAYSNFVHQHGE